jgi:hypothetical protein
MPDLMYGAVNIREEAGIEYIVPDYLVSDDAQLFIALADEVQSDTGFKPISVRNSNWTYTIQGDARGRIQTFTCALMRTDSITGEPMVLFTITPPKGKPVVGGISYRGGWIFVKRVASADDSGRGWYSHEALLPSDVYAIDAVDVDSDGHDELVVAGDRAMNVYRLNGAFLEPVYSHPATRDSSDFNPGAMGYLCAVKSADGVYFYRRGPRDESTTVCKLAAGGFTSLQNVDSVPAGYYNRKSSVIFARPDAAYHMFAANAGARTPGGGSSELSMPVKFSFVLNADLDTTGGIETAMQDSHLLLWLNESGEWKNTGALTGMGLWSFDIDGDGYDELVTTGRDMAVDSLEYYNITGGRVVFAEESPVFDGTILDVAFGDFNGDGESEPGLLIASGTERRIVF